MARYLVLGALLFLVGCAAPGTPEPTAEAERRDACARSYGPGTAGLALCLRGVYEP